MKSTSSTAVEPHVANVKVAGLAVEAGSIRIAQAQRHHVTPGCVASVAGEGKLAFKLNLSSLP